MIAVYIILGLLVGFILAVILPRALLRKLERKDEGKEEGEGRYCTGHSPDLKLLRKYMHLVPPGFTSKLSRRISSVCRLARRSGQHISFPLPGWSARTVRALSLPADQPPLAWVPIWA
jgi:hypothetical protein